jgi:hypothetical protein
MITRHVTLILAAQLTFCLSASAQDHLEPEQAVLNQPEWQWDYAKRLREVLLKDGATYHLARMVCLPAFEPEWVVTVVREDGEDFDAPHSYYVEYVGAEKKLFRPKEPHSSAVKRSRAPLDRETAESLNKTWRRMLRATRYARVPGLGADGVNYHFSRFVAMTDRGQSDPLAGWEQGWIWTPDEESPCGEIVAIGERLKEYAQAKPEVRDKIAAAIRSKADQLRVKLERRARGGQIKRRDK